uniref:Major capsid protein n=1 Tax=Siphoviridae sp. ctwDU14 TaxID=2825726 RepID=A0A8S5PG00_9CAUD|nr:MAG TPA: Major capsid protein [Siphoviridae sp. ctwDU14]
MANAITLAQTFVPILDKVYKNASLTAVLDGNPELVRQGANYNELIIPKISMQGLGDYSRNGGYVHGDVTLNNETVKCNFDRGRMFTVDNMDNMETVGIAFGQLGGEFLRTKVAPELDAFRFAQYAGTTGISKVGTPAALADGAAVIAALRAGVNKMDEDEVDPNNRYLFITPTLYGMIRDLDTTKSKEVLESFTGVVKVPQSRFYTAIDQYDGTTSGEEGGGYVKDTTNGCDINFMIIEKSAVIQFEKHVAPKIITPEQNQNADAYKFGYRNVGIADVYENKVAGIYLHHKPKG